MKLSKQILFTISLLCIVQILNANIEVRVTAENQNGGTGVCQGYIEVTAEGDAGPFEITLYDNDFPDVVWDQGIAIQGEYTFYNLYYGQYTIIVTNDYGCETIFTESISCDCNMYVEFAQFQINNAINGAMAGNLKLLRD